LPCVLSSACALIPAPRPVPAAICLDCATTSVPAYAVTRPALCNDYPVSYRVHGTDARDRVRPVDGVTLSGASGAASLPAVCSN
jgi:hypothetical protein